MEEVVGSGDPRGGGGGRKEVTVSIGCQGQHAKPSRHQQDVGRWGYHGLVGVLFLVEPTKRKYL